MLKKIARDWRIKCFVQNMLGLVPGSAGFLLNEKMVQIVRGDVTQRRDSISRIRKGIDNIKLVKDKTNFDINRKNVMEIGTGWHGIDLILFYLLGAKSITTLDHYKHLTFSNLTKQVREFDREDIIERLYDLTDKTDVDKRLNKIRFLAKKCITLDGLLEGMNIRYEQEKYCLPHNLILKEKIIDFFYSESVLQRIPNRNLCELFSIVGKSCMRDGGVFFHRTDQKDINSQEHIDTSLWGLNYLKYSDFFFNVFISGKFNSQNRLRESDFVRLLLENNMSATFVESYYRNNDLDRMRSMRLAKKFRDKDIIDLATTSSKVIGYKNSENRNAGTVERIVLHD